jgi:hypothetical protein
MRAVLCATLILVCLMTVAAQRSSQLYGYVRYSDYSAAKGVVVSVGDYNVITNDAGYYKVASVSSGDNAVLITPPGKATKSFTVNVGSGPTQQDFKIDW